MRLCCWKRNGNKMTDDYLKARKAGEKTYKEKVAEGEYPFLPALDDILPDADMLTHKPLGLMEIPVGMIAGTKTMARQNAFAPDFMPLLEPDSEFGTKWSSLYNAQISEGFSDPIKVYEYMHRFYVQEGNKRVSVSRYLDMPVIMADVTRIVPPAEVLAENPVYAEFLRFYDVAPIYEIETSWEGSYSELAELLDMDLVRKWPEETVKSLKNLYWIFTMAMESLGDKVPDLLTGDAFMVYLRIYINDGLRHYPQNIVEKRILRIKKELLIEHNKERVALVETPEEALGAGSIITMTESVVGKVIPVLSYSPKNPLKAAFIYDKSIDGSSRIADHEKGRIRLEKAYGGSVKTKCYENCNDSESFEAAADDAARWGADAVFTTSPGQINDALRAAIRYGGIEFLNCSINLPHQAVRSYYAKTYEAKFLAGIVAGTAASIDGTHKIGYCSDYPIYGTVAGINAFAIGAAMVDPEVRIYLEWETKRDTNWWWSMVDRGIRVISAVDSLHNADGSDAFGVCCVDKCEAGKGNDLSGTCDIKNLAVPVIKWGKLYEIIVKTMLDGSYHSRRVDKKDQATNYWWGMISGVVDVVLGDVVSPYTRRLVETFRNDIIEGRFNPFDAELRSQSGLIRGENDEPLSSLDVIRMDWLNENIIGEIPKLETIKEEEKATVKFSGVESTRK